MNVKPGQSLLYDDGRPGHRVTCIVIDADREGMLVQFADRASPTWINFSERAWMDYLWIIDNLDMISPCIIVSEGTSA